jgi:ketosteroid isomerase-like protein
VTDDEKLAVAARYIAATRAGDLDALAAACEPAMVVWHNHDGVEVDGAATLRTLGWLHRTVPDIDWETAGLRATGDGFVWQAVTSGTAPGGPLRLHTCAVVTLSAGGKVARIDEYLDSGALAPLAAPA